MKRIISTLIMGILLWCGCKKVDDHATLVANQPWLAESYSQTGGTHLSPLNWTYPVSLVVGDTAMLIGQLFPDRPGTVITIGNIPVKIIDTAVLATNYTTYNPQPPMSAVRFIITEEMGVGNERPVSVTANGVTIYGQPINIRLVRNGNARTDTTLWVDKVATWRPDNQNEYTQYNYNMVRSVQLDKQGNICFDNQLSVQLLSNGQFSPLLKAGDQLRDNKGSAFSIKNVQGSAISFSGETLYFSVETTENVPEAADHYIFRLCKMDIAGKTITTLNRTLVMQHAATDETQVPLQGDIGGLKIVAQKLNTDYNNNLFFTNYYAPGMANDNRQSWYDAIGGSSAGQVGNEPYGCVLLISRMNSTGQVRGLMSNPDAGYPTVGLPVVTGMYTIDPDGKYLYGYYSDSWISFDMVQYDLLEDDRGTTLRGNKTPFAYHSFENDPAYKLDLDIVRFNVDPYSVRVKPSMQMSDGTMLYNVSHCIVNWNFTTQSAYTYAGAEKGFYSAVPPGQDKETGRAKWVDFNNISFVGQDKNGAVYFFKDGDASQPPVFYKIYPRQS